MTIVGTSTPSSGAEHFISHYWDLMALLRGEKKHLHGVQVGVATLIALKLYDYVRALSIRDKVSMERLKRAYLSKEEIRSKIAGKFGVCAKGIEDEFMKKYLSWDDKRREIEWIIENWEGIWKELEPFIRPAAPVERALKVSGTATSYRDLGKKRDEVVDVLYNALYIRGRYTILDLIVDLGLLEEAIEIID
jgi:glycerol-1-phosphate dehydrogenase [NAD(P)+]